VISAGNEAGRYLDQIGVTDMAKLTDAEWREFLRRVIVAFEHSLRDKILSGVAPF
jgi:hypothetical protein